MVFYTNPIPCVIIALILAIHIAVNFLKRKASLVLTFVNICLHIGLLAAIFLLGADITEATLLLSFSLLFYIAFSYFLRKKRDEEAKL